MSSAVSYSTATDVSLALPFPLEPATTCVDDCPLPRLSMPGGIPEERSRSFSAPGPSSDESIDWRVFSSDMVLGSFA